MKKLLMAILIIGSTNQMLPAGGWTPVSQAQAERDSIIYKIKQIRAHHQTIKFQLAGMGGARSSAYQSQDGLCQKDIFNLLKSIGTPVSYKILQEMCASGELPKSYLGQA